MSTNICLPANPEISGIGIRAALYIQSLLSFLTAFYALSSGKFTSTQLNFIEAQSSTILVIALGILASAIAKGITYNLSNVHAAVILNFGWISNTNLFIYILLYLHHTASRSNSDDASWEWQCWLDAIWGLAGRSHDTVTERKEKLIGRENRSRPHDEVLHGGQHRIDSMERRSPVFVLFLGTFHLSLMAIVGVWMWTDPLTFGFPLEPCSVSPSLVILGNIIPITSISLRRLSVVAYSLVAIPLLNVLVPTTFIILFYTSFNRRYRNIRPTKTFFARIIAYLSPNVELNYEVFPIFACLVILAFINVVIIIDTEATLRWNKHLQETGESNWTFGHTLSVLLLLIPLRGTLGAFTKYDNTVPGPMKTVYTSLSELGGDPDLLDENGDLSLLKAAFMGRLDIIKHMGVHLDVRDQDGNSLLHQASIGGHLEVVRYLGARTTQLSPQDKNSNSPLHQATMRGHLDIVRYLGDNGALLDLQDKNGNSSLHQATIRGYLDIVRYLGDKGAQLSLQDENGNSPLHQAAIRGYLSIVQYLGDKKAQLDLQDKNGNSPLHQATIRGYLDMVKYLGDKGAQLDLQDENSNSPLHQAALRGYLDIVKYLGDKGAKLDLQDKTGNSPLHQAAIRGYLDIVRYLGDKNAQLDLQDEKGNSALHQATIRGYFDIVRYLGDKGANLDLQDINGTSALHQATFRGNLNIVKYLGDKGAQLDLEDKFGHSPLYIATLSGHSGIADYLRGKQT